MKTVFVGLSGGVDSAVSAYLLKRQGYNVVGAFIKGWEPDFLPCTGVRDRLEAMRVAAHLGIPFKTYDLEEAYKREVVDYFIAEYRAGRTPNPDVMCNRAIKFGAFWEKAKADGADAIATGHYAIREREGEKWHLKTSADREKDQTYFLWTLTQDDLAHALFPVGAREKNDVRKLALEAKLPNASRPDSQGLCFLGHVEMEAFLKRYLPVTPGVMRDERGNEAGSHDGAWFYTLGQHVRASGSSRRYVVGKNMEKNELIVSEEPFGEEAKKEHALVRENWISEAPDDEPLLVRYRYRQPLITSRIRDNKVIFHEPHLIAPGQSLVVYDKKGEICLGGAVIA